ncbi:MAG TPA: phosphoglycerate dehydrogenase [Phycisphaerales bacterium]|nr:phosphoglycerate dehydrogenase [Phycisphaerales bacterium]
MKILIADKLSPEGPEFLRAQPGVEVTIQPGLSPQALAAALREHEGVVVRSAVQITADVLERAMADGSSRLRAIARAGVGVDNIDLEAATRLGVAVMYSASASTITTAEHAFALMIALARNIAQGHMAMAVGGWDRNKYTGRQLHGMALGIVGFGRIGQTMAQRAIAFGMNVIGFDPFVNADSALDGEVKLVRSFDELIAQVDVVSFHVPKTESTSGMLSREAFRKARRGLLVVNAARGGIVDEQALLEAIESGQCGGAAIDVFEEEPPPKDDPLRNHPKILLTPHLGASTVEAQEAVALDACKAMLKYLRGEPVDGMVNMGKLSFDLSDRQRAFVDLASRMIPLLQAVASDMQIGAVRFTMRGESVAGRADTIARYALADLLRSNLDQPVNVVNAAMLAEQRRIDAETTIVADLGDDRIAIELVDREGKRSHRVEGAIYGDGLPRITYLDGYSMDMVSAGQMVLLTNADEPGRIGLVGKLFGDAGVNIAEMVIGRKPATDAGAACRQVAMMILKLDDVPTDRLIESLRAAPGILGVAAVNLPAAGPV